VDLSIYREWRNSAITASGYPVKPPTEWFQPDQLRLKGPTPITVLASGQIFGHIALWGQQHTGYDRPVTPPRSRSGYAFFRTGQVLTADGSYIPVGNLTYAGGHAPVATSAGEPVSAAAAVAHYDNTGSSFADVVPFEDEFGILVAGAMRPTVTDEQLRTILASAPSGDWRPINGALELIACCQVNVPGFPVVRALAASGALTASASGEPEDELLAIVAAGAPDLYRLRLQQMAAKDFELANSRIEALEAKVASLTHSGWAPKDEKWSATAAAESLFAFAEAQTDDMTRFKPILSSAFLFVGGDGTSKDDYHFPVAVARNGRIEHVWRGVVAAFGGLHTENRLSPADQALALKRASELQADGRRVLGLEPVSASVLPKKLKKKLKKKMKKLKNELKGEPTRRTQPYPFTSDGSSHPQSSARSEFLRQQMAYLTAGGTHGQR
jgi:hypothetical protein